jgi:AcrR family transcriptional regulator
MTIMKIEGRPAKRRYSSAVRASAAAAKRDRVIDSAAALLAQIENFGSFSIELVAREAGVTRLTVYNQFESRRRLLKAVLDRLAERGGLGELKEAVGNEDPRTALEETVRIFCRFWSDPAVMRLQDAVTVDGDFKETLQRRHEGRRRLMLAIIKRAAPGASAKSRADLADLLFALTSPGFYRLLSRNRSPRVVCRMIAEACFDALDRAQQRKC